MPRRLSNGRPGCHFDSQAVLGKIAPRFNVNTHFAWSMIVLGGVLLLIGCLSLLWPISTWFGRLPGDIRVEGRNFRFYFPIATCLLLSLVLTLVIGVIRFFR
jgi:hypothetical protein